MKYFDHTQRLRKEGSGRHIDLPPSPPQLPSPFHLSTHNKPDNADTKHQCFAALQFFVHRKACLSVRFITTTKFQQTKITCMNARFICPTSLVHMLCHPTVPLTGTMQSSLGLCKVLLLLLLFYLCKVSFP